VPQIKKAAGAASKTFLTNIAKEIGEEELVFGMNLITDASYGLALPEQAEFLANQKELVAGVLMLSNSLGTVGAAQTFKDQKLLIYNQVAANVESVKLGLLTTYQELLKSDAPLDIQKEYEKAIYFARDIKKLLKIRLKM